MKCVACSRDAPTVTEAEIAELRPQVPDRELLEVDGVKRLDGSSRSTTSRRRWTSRSGPASSAEEEGHHPALLTEWGRTTVTWWTHKIKWPASQRLHHGSEDGPALSPVGATLASPWWAHVEGEACLAPTRDEADRGAGRSRDRIDGRARPRARGRACRPRSDRVAARPRPGEGRGDGACDPRRNRERARCVSSGRSRVARTGARVGRACPRGARAGSTSS